MERALFVTIFMQSTIAVRMPKAVLQIFQVLDDGVSPYGDGEERVYLN